MKKLFGSIVGTIAIFGAFLSVHASGFPIQTQTFQISPAGASIGDTTLGIISFNNIATSSAGGIPITSSQIGSVGFGTIEPGNGGQEESVEFTGVTQNANGSATLTGVSDCGMFTPYTLTSGLTKSHAGASTFVLSNTACFYSTLFANILNPQTITGLWSFTGPIPTISTNATSSLQITNLSTVTTLIANATSSGISNLLASNNTWTGTNLFSNSLTANGTNIFGGAATFNAAVTLNSAISAGGNKITSLGTPTANTDAATKQYVDGVSIAGSPISNNTTTGIGRTASSTQIANGLSGTSTPYFIPSTLASSTASTTSSIVVSTNPSSGQIDNSFLATSTFGFVTFGNEQVFTATTSTSNFAQPAGVTRVFVRVIGGGGGGGGADGVDDGAMGTGGGGGGGYAENICTISGNTIIQAGAEGARGTATQSTPNGGQGGTSSFGTCVSASGGASGASRGTLNLGGTGGTASTTAGKSLFVAAGQNGGFGFSFTGGAAKIAGDGGGSIYGSGALKPFSIPSAGTDCATSTNGYGGGGSGAVETNTNVLGGRGCPGIVIVNW